MDRDKVPGSNYFRDFILQSSRQAGWILKIGLSDAENRAVGLSAETGFLHLKPLFFLLQGSDIWYLKVLKFMRIE